VKALESMGMAMPTLPAVERPDSDAAAAELFAKMLVKEVRKAMPEGGLLGDGPFAVLEDLLDDALAKQIAAGNSLGLDGLLDRGTPDPHTHSAAPAKLVAGARLTSDFGPRLHPIHGTVRHHDGIDLAAPLGSTIRTPRAGNVVQAGFEPGYGNLVVVDHGRGIQTRYAHCDRLTVQVGDRVHPGSQLGTVGQTGQATGPHLHFEVRENGTPVDPRQSGFLDLISKIAGGTDR